MANWKSRLATRHNPSFGFKSFTPSTVFGSSASDDFYQPSPVRLNKLTRQESYVRKDEPEIYNNSRMGSVKPASAKRCKRYAIIASIFIVLWTAVGLAIYYGVFRNMKFEEKNPKNSIAIDISLNDSFHDNLLNLSSPDSIRYNDSICTALSIVFQNISELESCAITKFSPGSVRCRIQTSFRTQLNIQNIENILVSDLQSNKSIFAGRLNLKVTFIGVEVLTTQPASAAISTGAYLTATSTAWTSSNNNSKTYTAHVATNRTVKDITNGAVAITPYTPASDSSTQTERTNNGANSLTTRDPIVTNLDITNDDLDPDVTNDDIATTIVSPNADDETGENEGVTTTTDDPNYDLTRETNGVDVTHEPHDDITTDDINVTSDHHDDVTPTDHVTNDHNNDLTRMIDDVTVTTSSSADDEPKEESTSAYIHDVATTSRVESESLTSVYVPARSSINSTSAGSTINNVPTNLPSGGSLNRIDVAVNTSMAEGIGSGSSTNTYIPSRASAIIVNVAGNATEAASSTRTFVPTISALNITSTIRVNGAVNITKAASVESGSSTRAYVSTKVTSVLLLRATSYRRANGTSYSYKLRATSYRRATTVRVVVNKSTPTYAVDTTKDLNSRTHYSFNNSTVASLNSSTTQNIT